MKPSSTIQSLKSINDVFRPRFGGEGEGDGFGGFLGAFAGVGWAARGKVLAVVGEIGASRRLSPVFRERFAGRNTIDGVEVEMDEPARDSKAAIFA